MKKYCFLIIALMVLTGMIPLLGQTMSFSTDSVITT